jgi:hypothetical protein
VAKIQPQSQNKSAAAPTAPDAKKEKKEKKVRPAFELVGSKDPSVYPFAARETSPGVFAAVPAGFDFTKHAGLKKKDFAKPSAFLTYEAERLEWLAGRKRAKADLARKGGDQKGGGKLSKFQKTMAKMAELRADLESQGIDVEALLSQTKAAAATKAPEAAAQPAGAQPAITVGGGRSK